MHEELDTLWHFVMSIVNYRESHYVRVLDMYGYLKLRIACGCSSIAGDFPKQRSQTRTGISPQPRSGTGFLLVEHAPQTPRPQARQWCLVSTSENTWPHDWHACKMKGIIFIWEILEVQRVGQACSDVFILTASLWGFTQRLTGKKIFTT